MPIITQLEEDGFGNSNARLLIESFLSKIKDYNEVNEFYVKKMYGGLSGAEVWLVIPRSNILSPIIVKFGLADKIISEAKKYKRYIEPLIVTAKAYYIIEKNNVDFARIIKTMESEYWAVMNDADDPQKDEAIIGYTFVGGFNFNKTFPISDLNCDRLNNKTSQLCSVMDDVIYNNNSIAVGDDDIGPFQIEDGDGPFRVIDVAAIPWKEFIPIAKQTAWCMPSWSNFIISMLDKWNKNTKDYIRIFPMVVCHNDLRCANILVTKRNNIDQLFIIDYGLVNLGDPIKDLARLEADLLLRLKNIKNEQSVLREIIDATELCPVAWKTHDEQVMQTIFSIREKVLSLVHRFKKRFEGEFTTLQIYNIYLLHHASRFCRRHDPENEMDPRRLEYMWFTLSLIAKFLGSQNLEPPNRC